MNLRKLLVAALTLLGLAEGAWAVPAYPGKIRVRQADGTTLFICIHGDEHTNYITTDDGFPKSGPWDDKCLANRWGIENYVIPLHTFTINTNNIELT